MREQYSREQLGMEPEDLICRGGTVQSVSEGQALVLIDREEGCSSCSAKGTCGAMFAGDQIISVEAPDTLGPGDRVEIGVRPSAVVTSSILLFVFPALAFVGGIGLGYWLADAFGIAAVQWTGFGTGLLLFAASYLIIRMMSSKLDASGRYTPVITKVLQNK